MDTKNETSNENFNATSHKTDVICRLFHKIETLETCSFIDKVSGEVVGKYTCIKCKKKYLANSKRAFFRCYI